MTPLEEMKFGHRIALTFLIVLIILFALALIGWSTGGWDEAPAASPKVALCSSEPGINDKINKIGFEALDEAFRTQVEHLFAVWMKDETGQPERAGVGVKQAALAYVHARSAILNWNIPECR